MQGSSENKKLSHDIEEHRCRYTLVYFVGISCSFMLCGFINAVLFLRRDRFAYTYTHTQKQLCLVLFSFLAQLISCAITNHYLWRDCRCRRWQQHWWHWHCRQKLTSSSVPI